MYIRVSTPHQKHHPLFFVVGGGGGGGESGIGLRQLYFRIGTEGEGQKKGNPISSGHLSSPGSCPAYK